MNAAGFVVEERLERSIMSGLHARWSLGGFAGSGVGVLAAHAGLDARAHLGAMSALLLLLSVVATRGLVVSPRKPVDSPRFGAPSRAVLLIGLLGFCAIFAESASADWCAVYLKSVARASPAMAAAAYSVFATGMTTGRLSGDAVVRRLGVVRSVRLGGITATLGGLLVTIARTPGPAIAGFGLVGLGIAVVVPMAFTAAGRATPLPGHGIAGVATIAYGAGLAAPGTIGGIAEFSSISVSFGVVTAMTAAIALGAGALRRKTSRSSALLTSVDEARDPP
jgi:predicted MFS family arabinose efflux permease